MNRFLMAVFGLVAMAGPAAARCGDDPTPCALATGDYNLAMPNTNAAAPPVVVFLHGAGSNGAGVMRNKNLVNSLLGRGYAVLAPTGARQFRSGPGRVWNFLPNWEGRDETEYLKQVVADAATNSGINPNRVLLAGFSAGAFMVTYLACNTPDVFAAYAPVSGGFWRPQPVSCAGPVKLFHTHGWRDKTVPIEGRFLGGGRYQQGDIFAGLEILRTANGCIDQRPDSYSETGAFWRRKWSECAPDTALELALFPGGHTVPPGWGDMVLDWFEAVTAE